MIAKAAIALKERIQTGCDATAARNKPIAAIANVAQSGIIPWRASIAAMAAKRPKSTTVKGSGTKPAYWIMHYSRLHSLSWLNYRSRAKFSASFKIPEAQAAAHEYRTALIFDRDPGPQ